MQPDGTPLALPARTLQKAEYAGLIGIAVGLGEMFSEFMSMQVTTTTSFSMSVCMYIHTYTECVYVQYVWIVCMCVYYITCMDGFYTLCMLNVCM